MYIISYKMFLFDYNYYLHFYYLGKAILPVLGAPLTAFNH